MRLCWLLFLAGLAQGDISEKLRQGQSLAPPGSSSNFPGLQPPTFGGNAKGTTNIKSSQFQPKVADTNNSGKRIVLPSHHHDDDDENNLDRLCNDPFHSFLCKPVGPRKHRFDGNLRPGAVLPTGVVLSGESSDLRESKQSPLRSGSALLSSEIDNNSRYQYPKPTNPFEPKLPSQQPGYSYPKPQPNNQLILPQAQQTVQTNVKVPQGYHYQKPSVQLAYPSEPSTTKAPPPGPAYEYLPSFGSPPPNPPIDIRIGLPESTNLSPVVQQTQQTFPQQSFLPRTSFSFGSNNNLPVGKPTNNAPQSVPYTYPKPTTGLPTVQQPKIPPQNVNHFSRTNHSPVGTTPTTLPSFIGNFRISSESSAFPPVRTSATTSRPHIQPLQNAQHLRNYLPPVISPVPKPSTNINITVSAPKFNQNSFQNHLNFPQNGGFVKSDTQPQLGISRPIPNFPAPNFPNIKVNVPSNQQGYQYSNPPRFQISVRPSTSTSRPTTKFRNVVPSNEYLPSDNRLSGESTNLQPNIEGGALLAEEIDGPSSRTQPRKQERTHTLEELCNDAFHSFLCKPITKPRKRIDGRIRPGAQIPPHVLQGSDTITKGARRLPPNEEGSALLSTEVSNDRVIPGYHYNKPQIVFQSTNIQQQTAPFPNPIFVGAASDALSLAKVFNGQIKTEKGTVPTTLPPQTRATTQPSTKFPTTRKQTLISSTTTRKTFPLEVAGSSQTENKGYFYEKPSGSNAFTYPTRKPQGYVYTKPPPGREFTLPNYSTTNTAPPKPFGTRLLKPEDGQSQVREKPSISELANSVRNEKLDEDTDLPPASQFEVLKP